MGFWQAIILGIVEGVTEYLPISSTGHLILTQRLLGLPESEASNAYAICIQAGAILAVVGLYWGQVRDMIAGVLGKVGIGAGSTNGFRLAMNIVIAFLPAAVVGLLFDDRIESELYGMWPVVSAWFVGGLAILYVSRTSGGSTLKTHDGLLDQLTWQTALAIGFIQCLAMWPGTSRSLVTIVGGVLVGLSLPAAVEFSFLLGVVTLLAATVYKARDAGPVMYETYGVAPMIVGSIAAWIAAVVAIKWMVGYLKQNGMRIFGYYRVALAILVGCGVWQGLIKN